MKRKIYTFSLLVAILLAGCKQTLNNEKIEGKINRESVTITTKIPGRVEKLNIQEGDTVLKGDTLAILGIPEVDAKIAQALGAVKSADAQYKMSENGATKNQLKQLEAKHHALKEQYEFAQKSFDRVDAMFSDSLISPQKYDEAVAKYQGAKSQYDAVAAELEEVKNGVRLEQRLMALGQKDRASGALQEAEVASKERYIIAPTNMTIETVTLHIGELATPGYTLFSGYLPESTWFRVTIPEAHIGQIKKGQQINIYVPYLDKEFTGKVAVIKQLAKYANITTAYPDYELEQSLYELKIVPDDKKEADRLLTNASILIKE
ncbi:efflux RND transporter periplasmic adaptor subunit [Olivibacter sp. SDN3]|uniref:HlyD family secretion protein n=1 Tax=Olivibacter sp. SDN3 TaxID=2764720 RepID=UPI0016518E65|nr:efflux RND transporter periplasmic adaptor subunit [Olivibacter sp. SDN3]QNL48529.1 efflux RND transporter periplasmic adaptor subunit [Olivibacter sp. SDN3]